MQLQNFYAQDSNGNTMPLATGMLYLPGTTTLATGLQDATGAPLSNPFNADTKGLIAIAAPNGYYDLVINAGTKNGRIRVMFIDVDEVADDAATASDAATAAQAAAAVATSRTVSFLAPRSVGPTVRDDGSALQVGDRYFNTVSQAEYIYKTGAWALNDSLAAINDLENGTDPSKGTALLPYDQTTVQAVLDDNRPLPDYAALMAYNGRAKTIRIVNEGISGRFRNRGAAPGVPDFFGISFRSAAGDLWQRINAERVLVDWFGTFGDGVTDDTPAFNRASNYMKAFGGGTVHFNKKHLLDTALTTGDYVTFSGQIETPGELRYDGSSNYDGKSSLIIQNSAVTTTLGEGSSFTKFLMMRKGLDLPFTNATTAAAGIAAFAGVAFTAGGPDTSLSHALILGFDKYFYCNGFERPRVDHVQADCNSGLDFQQVLDIAYVDRSHLWPFTTTHSNWTTGALNSRPGVGFNFQNVGDWSKLTNCFTYGYAKGFRVDGCNFVNLIGCGTDGYGAAASTAIGFEITGISKMTTLDACQVAAQGRGVVVNNNIGGLNGTAAVTKIINCAFWDSDIKHIDVITGSAIIVGNSFWRSPIGVDTASAAFSTIDDNYFEEMTSNAISSGSFDNLNVGELNRFVNCTNNIGPRSVLDANGTTLKQLSNDSANGVGVQPRRSRGTTAAKASLALNDIIYNLDPYGHEGTNFVQAGGIRQVVKNTPAAANLATAWLFSSRAASASSAADAVTLDSDGGFKPVTDNARTLGSSTQRWASVWSATGTIQTSDERTKVDIKDAALGLEFITALRPVSYRWKEGAVRVVRQVMVAEDGRERAKDEEGNVSDTPGRIITESIPGTRTHWGLIAQEVKKVVTDAGVDFAGWVLSDPDDEDSQQALRYDQFISPLIKAAQELAAKNEALEARLAAVEEKLSKL